MPVHTLPEMVQAQNRKHKSTFIPGLFAHCCLKVDLCFQGGILKLAYNCDDRTPVFIKGNSSCATMGRNITSLKQHRDTSSQWKMVKCPVWGNVLSRGSYQSLNAGFLVCFVDLTHRINGVDFAACCICTESTTTAADKTNLTITASTNMLNTHFTEGVAF